MATILSPELRGLFPHMDVSNANALEDPVIRCTLYSNLCWAIKKKTSWIARTNDGKNNDAGEVVFSIEPTVYSQCADCPVARKPNS